MPGSLVAVIFGVVVVKLFDLADKGVDIVGDIASGLPAIGPPDGIGGDDYLRSAGAAGGLMLVGFAEGLGAAKTYATREHYEIDPNRELLGLGAANLGSWVLFAGWSSTAASRRPPSTARPAPGRRCPDSSSPR